MMPTTLQIALFMCGLLGSALKSYVTQSQGTFSRRSVGDILTGGVVAVLVPIYAPALLPGSQNIFGQAMVIFALSYFSSDLLMNVLTKVGIKGIDSGTPKQGG